MKNVTTCVSRSKLWPMCLGLLLLAPTAHAQNDKLYNVQESPELQVGEISATDPYVRWYDYLDQNGFNEGYTDGDETPYFIASGSAEVKTPFGRSWVNARNAAVQNATLNAKASLAEFLSSEIESSSNLELFSRSSNELPPTVATKVAEDKQLSLVQKSTRLLHAEVDLLISRHDPSWDGTGKSDAERNEKIVLERNSLNQDVSTLSPLLIHGATPIYSAEGFDDQGTYTVLVGLVWSPNSSALANSFSNPNVAAPKGRKGESIISTLKNNNAIDSSFMASFNGIRVWRDENGNKVLVSSASSDRGLSDASASAKNRAKAKAQIASFIAETIVSTQTIDGELATDIYDDGSNFTYDQAVHISRINSLVPTMGIQGIAKLREWRVTHPISGSKMLVTVMTLSENSMTQAGNLANHMSSSSKKKADNRSRQATQSNSNSRRILVGPSATIDDF